MGEMTQLPWNADLVTLSACDTGLGDLYPGDGMMGLSTMLLATGNRGTVLSRWRVPDESAPLFMKLFYEEIQKGAGKPQALRNAQLGFFARQGRRLSGPATLGGLPVCRYSVVSCCYSTPWSKVFWRRCIDTVKNLQGIFSFRI